MSTSRRSSARRWASNRTRRVSSKRWQVISRISLSSSSSVVQALPQACGLPRCARPLSTGRPLRAQSCRPPPTQLPALSSSRPASDAALRGDVGRLLVIGRQINPKPQTPNPKPQKGRWLVIGRRILHGHQLQRRICRVEGEGSAVQEGGQQRHLLTMSSRPRGRLCCLASPLHPGILLVPGFMLPGTRLHARLPHGSPMLPKVGTCMRRKRKSKGHACNRMAYVRYLGGQRVSTVAACSLGHGWSSTLEHQV